MRINVTELKHKNVQKIPTTSLLTSSGRLRVLQPVVAIPKPKVANIYGTKETIEAIKLIAAITNILFSIGIKGWTGIGWVTIVWNVWPVIKTIIPGLSGIGSVVDEIEDLDPMEKQELIDAIKEELAFTDNVEDVIAVALDIIYKLKNLAGVFK